MNQLSKILIGVCLSITSLVLCSSPINPTEERVADLVAKLKQVRSFTENDVRRVVAHAAAADRSVMFIHIDWAPMEPQRTEFAKFSLACQTKAPTDDILFHYVDCTPISFKGYRPLRALPGWKKLEQERNGSSLVHAWGEIIWLDHGRVIQAERILDFESTAELLTFTETVFSRPDKG